MKQTYQAIIKPPICKQILIWSYYMSSTYPEPKQIACMKRGRCDFETGAKTVRFADYIPTRREKVIQKAGRDSLGVPQEDPEESLRFGRVVVAGGHNEQGK
jgi:hypothetical protein